AGSRSISPAAINARYRWLTVPVMKVDGRGIGRASAPRQVVQELQIGGTRRIASALDMPQARISHGVDLEIRCGNGFAANPRCIFRRTDTCGDVRHMLVTALLQCNMTVVA